MIAFFLLLFLLDIQHSPKMENPLNSFVVTDAPDNTSLSTCTMNPSSGGQGGADMISVDQHAAGPHNELPLGYNNPLLTESTASSLVTSSFEGESLISPMMMPYDPPGLPDLPEPETPPVTATPEPPTAAILGISGIALLYLLFGRKRQKLHRRTR